MRWKQGADISKLAGQTIRLRFVEKRTDLYSFQFQLQKVKTMIRVTFASLFSLCSLCLSVFVTAAETEGPLKPHLGQPQLELQQVFKGERFGNVVVTMKGTVLATWGTSHVRAARSEDGGKTWGPEIVVWDDGANSINNPCPIVDPKNGRIWCCMGRYNPYPNANQHVVYSDDDGKTWPWKQTYYEGGSGYSDVCVLPGGRVAVLFEKDGKSNLGFTVLPAPPPQPPGAK